MIGYVTLGTNDIGKARASDDALLMDSRAKVDAHHAKASELGGTGDSPPGQMGFYGAYFRDIEENKLCAFNMGANQ
jgi:predicted lactoylglutathione lyase